MTKIARLDDRAVLRITGSEARLFLQGLLTNDVEALAEGKPLWAGLLSAQGKYLFDMILHAEGDSILADVWRPRAEELAKRLTMYKLRRDVGLESTGLSVFAAWAGESTAPYDPRLPGLGRRWVSADGEANTGADEYDKMRIYLGVPDSADFMVDKLMWLESNAVELNGVSFTKGCYVGQENTARMHHRDKLRRRLLPVLIAGEPGKDRVIRSGEREAGELRTTRDGRGIAYLRLEQAGPGDVLSVGGAQVKVDWPTWIPAANLAPEA
jgi:folate-binding protein YgfZ